jgi:hypothetical protein
MKKWLTGVRGTVLMILTWTVGWGLGFGGLMELYDPSGRIEDVWPTALAIPGFIGGIVFCTLFRMAEGRRSFFEVPFARIATWGVATGIVLGLLGVAAGVGSDAPRAIATMIGVAAVLGVVAAFGSAVFFRILSRQMPALAERMG